MLPSPHNTVNTTRWLSSFRRKAAGLELIGVWFIVTFSTLLLNTQVFAQTVSTTSFSVRNSDLPQNNVMRVYLAPDGALWVATYGGAARFNGKRFDTYNVQNGLTSNTTYDIYVKNDTTWILTRDGLDIIVNGKVQNYFYSDSTKFYHGKIYKSKNHHYIYGFHSVFLFDVKAKKLITNFHVGDTVFGVYPIFHRYGSHIYKDVYYFVHDPGVLACSLNDYQGQVLISNEFLQAKYGYQGPEVSTLRGSDDLILIAIEEMKYPQDANICHHVFQFSLENEDSCYFMNTRHLLPDSDLTFSYFSAGKGKVTFNDMRYNIYNYNGKELDYLFNPANMPQYTLASPNNLWLGTDNGLWKVAMSGFEYFRPEDGFPKSVWGVFSIGDSLIMSSNSGGINLFKDRKLLSATGIKSFNFSAGGTLTPNNDIYLPFNQGVLKLKKGEIEKKLDFPDVGLTTAYDPLKKMILGGCLSHLIAIDTNDQVIELLHTPDLGINNSILSILPMEDCYLLGLSRGLAEYNPETQSARLITHENVRVNDLEIDQKGNIWAATDHGLMRIENERFIPVFNQYINEVTLTLAITDNQKLFIAGNTTLFVLDINAYEEHRPHAVLAYHQSAGFDAIGPLYNSFFRDEQGNLWLPTSEWVIKIEPDKIYVPENHPKATFVKAFAMNKSKTDTLLFNQSQKQISVPFSFNNFTFSFEAVDLDFPEALRFEYKLEGVSDKWLALKDETKLTFDNLPFGSYTLKVRATRTESFEHVPIETVSLKILPPFWFQWWFISIVALVLLGGLVYLYLYFIQRERIRSKRKFEILNLRSQALGVQMDNHFVVNCTSRIAMLNQQGLHEEAQNYTLVFVRFLQTNLKLLRQEWVSIGQELAMVDSYVQLEKLGGKDFQYEVYVSEKVNTEQFLIPPFLIQPLIENAIRHGLKSNNRKEGQISLHIEPVSGQGVLIKITDNGSGFKKKQINTGNGISMHIIRERLNLIGNFSRIEIDSSEAGSFLKLYILNQPKIVKT